MGMNCKKHNYHGSSFCNYCLEYIIEKQQKGKLTEADAPLVSELKKWVDKEVSDGLPSF